MKIGQGSGGQAEKHMRGGEGEDIASPPFSLTFLNSRALPPKTPTNKLFSCGIVFVAKNVIPQRVIPVRFFSHQHHVNNKQPLLLV